MAATLASGHRTDGWGSYGLGLVIVVAAVLLLRRLGDASLGYPDADRILLDGVFVLDLLHDLPLTRLYDYTIQYYGQYPALSVGYRPPFFPLVEALFNGALGISLPVSRLAVLAFFAVGVGCWYRLVERVYDTRTAFAASLLLVTTPFVACWGWYTMAELPVLSMAMITGYLFHRYLEGGRAPWLYAAAAAFCTAVWTKQTAAVLALWLLFYTTSAGRLPALLRRREFWIACVLTGVVLAPLAAITLWLGDQNLAQSIGTGGKAAPLARLSFDNLGRHLGNLYAKHLTHPALVLALIGLGLAALRRDRRALCFVSLIVATYLFFTYLVGKNVRYPIFWIPAFTVFAGVALAELSGRGRVGTIAALAVLISVTGHQISRVYSLEPAYARGYDRAAEYVLAHSRSPVTFFDGYNNGYFIYFMRALDPSRGMWVLRGDKLLTSSSIGWKMALEEHVASQEDILRIFDAYGVELVVIEAEHRAGLKPHLLLREVLRNGPFDLVATIPVETNRRPLLRQSLLLYRYRMNRAPGAGHLELDLPVVGKRLEVPFRTGARTIESGRAGAPEDRE